MKFHIILLFLFIYHNNYSNSLFTIKEKLYIKYDTIIPLNDFSCNYIPDSIYPINLKLKWKLIQCTKPGFGGTNNIVVDNNNFIYTYTYRSFLGEVINSISKIDGNIGTLIKEIDIDTTILPSPESDICIYRTTNNSDVSIITTSPNNIKTHSFLDSGTKNWTIDSFSLDLEFDNKKLADFNGDGIVELYAGNNILNAENGAVLFNGKNSSGCNFWLSGNPCSSSSNSITADLTPHNGLELAAGNGVYEIDIVNTNGQSGNTFNFINAPNEVKEGYTAVADFNNDGFLDVVTMRSNRTFDGGIWIWDPRNLTLLAEFIPPFDKNWPGGLPSIMDINNDCFPEIIITYNNELHIYSYDGSKSLNLINTIKITDNSGKTSMTLFDLNSDGKIEIIYRDEIELMILDPLLGIKLDSFPVKSGTGYEFPIVADIDGDGQAEILVTGGINSRDTSYVLCFESGGHPWAPARKVWNQTGYHITNVNDDLTIPRQQQNNAAFFDTDSCAQNTCNQPYNTFMCQATYRDQNGCVRWPAMDMVTDIIDYTCDGDSVTLRIKIRNQSTNTFRHDSVSLGLYSNGDDVPFFITQQPWEKSQQVDTITYTLPSAGISKIRARVNIPVTDPSFTANIKGLTSVLECDYENNTDSIAIDLAIKTLDLGPDITKCRTEAITLTAPNDFVSYQWSDFSQGNTYTTAETGIHTLITTDQCGRVYADSVELKIDVSLLPELGSDVTKCEDELITFSIGNEYEWVQWLPAQYVSCDTCHIININADTSFQLIMIGSNNGCIDADTVLVNITPLKKRNEEKFICRGDSTLFNGLYVSDEGMYEYRTLGCDSLVTLNLSVIPPDSIMLPTQEICRGDSLLFLGTWYKDGTNATIKLRNQYQCDSFITFELRVIDTLKTSESLSICEGDSIRIFDQWQSRPGVFTKSYQSARGCDSLAQVQLLVNSVFVNSESQKICNGDSIFLFNEWKKVAGIYSKKYQTVNGCDSTEQVQIIVEPLLVNSDSILICEGDSVVINGTTYEKEGSYQTILLSTVGCDTIYNFHLKYSPLLTKTENYSICEGDSVFINGNWLVPELVDGQAQVYVYEVREDNCKTEVTANFTINYSPLTNNKYILCPEDSILLNNTWVNSTTELTYILQSSEGCDSVIQAKVTKLSWPEPPVVELDCEDNVYNASIEADGWDILWIGSTGSPTSTSSTTTITESPASVKVSNDNDCEKTFDINIESLPYLSQLPSFDDQNIFEGNDINVKVDLPETEWQLLWLPVNAVSCDTCFETTISVAANTTITLELKHLNGCTYIRTFDIIIEKEIFTITIPNIINPTSTSGNNLWTVEFPDGYIVQEAKVYDRWGNVVYNNDGRNLISWDGKIDGCEVVPGVYVYFIRYLSPEGQMQVIKGDITVVR